MSEVNKLLEEVIVINISHKEGELISPIFLRLEPNGTNQVILNLKNLTKLWNTTNLKWRQFIRSRI